MVAFPSSEQELVEILTQSRSVQVIGTGSNQTIPKRNNDVELSLARYSGITKLSREDQVVTVKAGTSLLDLNNELREHGLCVPVGETFGSVGGWIAGGRPHILEAKVKPWRDWITGMKFALADGTIAKSGSEVVKSVAGYDIHRFLVGSRGYLAVILEVNLRIRPIMNLEISPSSVDLKNVNFILRTLGSRFEARSASFSGEVIYRDKATSTLHGIYLEQPDFKLEPNEWVMSPWHHEMTDRASKAKAMFDPAAKLNKGIFGEGS